MLEDKKHWAKVNRRAQTMLLLAGLRRVIEPHVNLEFSRIIITDWSLAFSINITVCLFQEDIQPSATTLTRLYLLIRAIMNFRNRWTNPRD